MTPSTIITQTACAYGLAPSALTSRDMSRRVAEARAVAVFLAYELTGASYAELGEVFGRERSCVRRLVDRVFRSRPLGERAARVELSLPAAGEQQIAHRSAHGASVACVSPR